MSRSRRLGATLLQGLRSVPHPEAFRRYREADQLSRNGHPDLAMDRLRVAVRDFPASPLLLRTLADLYRDDAQARPALGLYRLAALRGDLRALLRFTALAADQGFGDESREGLERLLALPPAHLLPHLPLINRVGVLHPELAERLAPYRARSRAALRWRVGRRRDAVDLAMACRWPDAAHRAARGPGAGEARRRYARYAERLGRLADLVELARENETGRMRALHDGRVVGLDDSSGRGVELFLPGAFFAANDKPTYGTIRRAFRHVVRALQDQPELAIVPRLQYSWRHARPRTAFPAISYHTVSDETDCRPRLHVHESPLAGRIAFDERGFAGFSSAAACGFSPPSTPASDLVDELRERYRAENRSKYTQPRASEPLPPRFIFVPLQVTTDPVARLASLGAPQLLSAVVEHARSRGLPVVVKRHPYCRSATLARMTRELAEHGAIQLSRGSIHDLLERASAVYTVNSGVGLEALLYRKPVVTTGDCEYQSAVTRVKDLAALKRVMREGPTHDRARVDAFFSWYCGFHAPSADDASAIARRVTRFLDEAPGRSSLGSSERKHGHAVSAQASPASSSPSAERPRSPDHV